MDRFRHHKSYSDELKATLNCYRLSSADSLGGPGGYSALAAQMWVKILTTVLKDFSINEINRSCSELHIYCSRCSPDQLEILKVLGVLPFNTTQCGLITKSDAERLISTLGGDHQTNIKQDFVTGKSKGIRVSHECFGQGDGIFYPGLYVTPDAPCISCMDCRLKLSPSKFVTHSHRGLEKRTCHWGFDRESWRRYIHLPTFGDVPKEEDREELRSLKEKFDHGSSSKCEIRRRKSSNDLKRKIKMESEAEEKKLKEDKRGFPLYNPSSLPGETYLPRPSAFKPWSTGLPLPLVTPSGYPPGYPSAQDSVFLKALGPLLQTGRLLPRYFPFAPPTHVPPTHAPPLPTALTTPLTSMTSNSMPSFGEWIGSAKSSQPVPNVTLNPDELEKNAEDFTLMKNKLRRDAMKRKITPLARPPGSFSWNPLLSSKSVSVKREVAEIAFNDTSSLRHHTSAMMNTSLRRVRDETERKVSGNGSKVERKNSRSPINVRSRDRSPINVRSCDKSSEHNDGQSKENNENELVDVIGDYDGPGEIVKDGHHEQPSSEEKLVKHIPSPPHSQPLRSSDADVPPNCPTYPMLTPLNDSGNHYKWAFPTASYVISYSGTQDLKRIKSLIYECPNGSKSMDILHEVVRLAWRSEEKLSMKMKMLKDVQFELKRFKSSQEPIDDRLRHQSMRGNYRSPIALGANGALSNITKKLIESQESPEPKRTSEREVIDQLKRRENEKELNVKFLEKKLMEEKDLRYLVGTRFNEMMKDSNQRIFSLMSGISPLESKLNGSYDRETSAPKDSSSSSLQIDNKEFQSDDDTVDVTNLTTSTTCTSPIHSSSKDSGVHDM